MKICNTCKQSKPLNEFSKRTASKDGLSYKCKQCTIDYCKQWRSNNPSYHQRWHTANAEKVCKQSKVYYTDNKKGIKERNKQYKRDNAKSILEYQRNRRALYPKQHKANGIINNMVQRGHMQPASTHICLWHNCKEKADDYHHYLGYEKQYRRDVVPLCRLHHNRIHIMFPHLSPME